ncbi:MAG: hypothetical protein ACI9OH_001411 [Oleispira sp.]|jgi:hypothetical protein
MNQLKALRKVLDIIPDNIEDILQKASTIEGKINQGRTAVSDYQAKAITWIDDGFEKAPHYVNDIFSAIESGLENNAVYQKIKSQDLTPLITLPEGFDFNDVTQVKTLMPQKISALKTFLAPLEIKNYDAIFNGIHDIITDLMAIPDNMDFTDAGMVAAFKQLKLKSLETKIHALLEEVLGFSLPHKPDTPTHAATAANENENETATNTATAHTATAAGTQTTDTSTSLLDIPEKLLTDLEGMMPELEQQLKSLEGQKMSVSAITGLIKNVEPLLKKLAASLPIPDLDVDGFFTKLEPIMEVIATEAKTINTTKTDLMVNSGLKALVNLLTNYIKPGSPFSPLLEILQKLQLVVGYVIENDLLIPLKIKKLPANQTVQQQGGLSAEWQAIQAANMANPMMVNNGMGNNGMSNTPVMGATGAVGNELGSNNGQVNGSIAANTQMPNYEQSDQEINGEPSNAQLGSEQYSNAQLNNGQFSNAEPTEENQKNNGALAVIEKLIKDGLAQLSPTQNQHAKNLQNGSAFTATFSMGQSVGKSLMSQLEQIAQSIKAAWQNKQLNTIGAIINMAVTNAKVLILAVINTIKQLIDELLKLIGTSINLLIDLVLAIKLPCNFLVSLVPKLNSLTKVNLLCLVVATPWDVLVKLKDLEVDVIGAWVK